MFPFGVMPEPLDALAPDTMNRLLLHAARYHDRSSVFTDGTKTTPDWRVDRLSIRLALALEETLGVSRSDVVALSLPFDSGWPPVERAIWALGASSRPLPPPVVPTEDEAIVTPGLREKLLERGAALDTPERASRLRARAREIGPSDRASIEKNGETKSHADWVGEVERFLMRNPPRRGMRRVISSDSPDFAARLVSFAGWIDGLTETVFDLE
ncbi:MAG TPA: hypothetical protein VLK65_09330 [Vicinamibacteria bacterium]|nr:hypothetical protein [Vicinamibacteria bacterium]